MQPRVQYFGSVFSSADWHERSGPASAVHVSAAVMAALQRAAAVTATAASTVADSVEVVRSPPPCGELSVLGVKGGEDLFAAVGGLRRSASLWSISTVETDEPGPADTADDSQHPDDGPGGDGYLGGEEAALAAAAVAAAAEAEAATAATAAAEAAAAAAKKAAGRRGMRRSSSFVLHPEEDLSGCP